MVYRVKDLGFRARSSREKGLVFVQGSGCRVYHRYSQLGCVLW